MKTYKKFLKEIKLANLANVFGDKDLVSNFTKYQHTEYIEDVPFIKKVYLEDYGIDINVIYHHNMNHDLLKRLSKRTEINTNSEFNENIEKVIRAIPDQIGKKIKMTGKYSFYLQDKNIHFILLINYDNLFTNYPKVMIITLFKGEPVGIIDTIFVE